MESSDEFPVRKPLVELKLPTESLIEEAAQLAARALANNRMYWDIYRSKTKEIEEYHLAYLFRRHFALIFAKNPDFLYLSSDSITGNN